MLCDEYKEALMEAAAGGAGLAGSVHEHVATCMRCGALLAEQRELFAAIDLGLRRSANAEIPNSLLPGVRARLADERRPKRSVSLAWALLAASTALVIGAVMVTRDWHPGATVTVTVQQTNPVSQGLGNAAGEKVSGSSRELSAPMPRRRREFGSELGVADAQPLVRAGDQEAINLFIDRAASGEIRGANLLTGEDLKRAEDLQIARIEIATIADNPPEEAGSSSHIPAVRAPEMSIDPDRRTK